MPDPIADRVVRITGATGPLGRAAAAAFAADSARLGLVGGDAWRLAAMTEDLGHGHATTERAGADLTDGSAAHDAVAAVVTRFGRIDFLLHLVGGWTGGTAVVDLEPEVLADMLDRYVWSTFHVARGRAGHGRAALGPNHRGHVHGAWAKGRRTHRRGGRAGGDAPGAGTGGGGRRITVNLLAVRAIDAAHERDAAPSPRTAHWTTPEEIVAAIRFLCSDQAAAINGARIPLDRRG